MNLHLSYVPFRFRIRIRSPGRCTALGSAKSAVRTPLDLFYLNFCITLAVALFALVLFAAFLFEDNNLIAFAVADDAGRQG